MAFSAQTLTVFAFLSPGTWRHGYELAKETGLKSGTLYPILIRLAERGLVEAIWEEEQPAGRPRRHLYRLTAEGARVAKQALQTHAATDARREAAGPRLAREGVTGLASAREALRPRRSAPPRLRGAEG